LKTAAEIIATLNERGLLPIAVAIAERHSLELGKILDLKSHDPEIVDARYQVYRDLRAVLPSNNAVARAMGVDHSTIDLALMLTRAVVDVVLDRWLIRDAAGHTTGEGYVFRWRRQLEPIGSLQMPFGVTTLLGTVGAEGAPRGSWERSTKWFAEYLEARAHFYELARQAGAPSFSGRSLDMVCFTESSEEAFAELAAEVAP
jgi:hypothetical protein